MVHLILVNPNGVDLCKYCKVGFCDKSRFYKSNYPNNKMNICPSYRGEKKWMDNNVKEVSEEDFKKGNDYFDKANRIE